MLRTRKIAKGSNSKIMKHSFGSCAFLQYKIHGKFEVSSLNTNWLLLQTMKNNKGSNLKIMKQNGNNMLSLLEHNYICRR